MTDTASPFSIEPVSDMSQGSVSSNAMVAPNAAELATEAIIMTETVHAICFKISITIFDTPHLFGYFKPCKSEYCISVDI